MTTIRRLFICSWLAGISGIAALDALPPKRDVLSPIDLREIRGGDTPCYVLSKGPPCPPNWPSDDEQLCSDNPCQEYELNSWICGLSELPGGKGPWMTFSRYITNISSCKGLGSGTTGFDPVQKNCGTLYECKNACLPHEVYGDMVCTDSAQSVLMIEGCAPHPFAPACDSTVLVRDLQLPQELVPIAAVNGYYLHWHLFRRP